MRRQERIRKGGAGVATSREGRDPSTREKGHTSLKREEKGRGFDSQPVHHGIFLWPVL